MVIVGLTGGIASGKSAVSEILSELGAKVIDADKVGHEAFHPGSDIRREVVSVFGEAILGENGGIDRGKLADIVFCDPEALKRLNGIMHPKMYEIVKEKIEAMRTEGNEVVVLEAALLIEAGWTDLVDQVWVVVAPESLVIDRLCQQKGLTREQAEARIKAQTTASQKVTSADVVITNDSDLESLRGKVEELWRSLK